MRVGRLSLTILALALAGCVGTDLVDDVLGPAAGAGRVELTPREAAVELGETVTLQAAYLDGDGRPQADAAFVWTSSSPTTASVSAAGRVDGLAVGQTMIVASSSGVDSEPALITVVAGAVDVARVTVTPAEAQAGPGQALQFFAVAYDLSGAEVPVPGFTWSSSDAVVATVDADGLAATLAPGETRISAATAGVTSLPATLRVFGLSRSGTFVQKPGSGHPVSGTALLAERSDGSLALGFGSSFASAGGPDVRVFLSRVAGVDGQSRDLGRLHSFGGAQSYDVPPGVGLEDFDWVVIHCVPFNITFGYAELGEPVP